MIYVTWVIWIAQIVLIVICMLNFLIAIVSDSYAFVMESEKMSYIRRREHIVYQNMYQADEHDNVYDLVLATNLDLQPADGEDWEGVTRTLKKLVANIERNNQFRH